MEFGRWKTDKGVIDCDSATDYDACEPFFAVPPLKIIKHVGFVNDASNSVPNDDIAIVKLKWPVMYTNLVRPICLPINNITKNEDVVVTGFGKLLIL